MTTNTNKKANDLISDLILSGNGDKLTKEYYLNLFQGDNGYYKSWTENYREKIDPTDTFIIEELDKIAGALRIASNDFYKAFNDFFKKAPESLSKFLPVATVDKLPSKIETFFNEYESFTEYSKTYGTYINAKTDDFLNATVDLASHCAGLCAFLAGMLSGVTALSGNAIIGSVAAFSAWCSGALSTISVLAWGLDKVMDSRFFTKPLVEHFDVLSNDIHEHKQTIVNDSELAISELEKQIDNFLEFELIYGGTDTLSKTNQQFLFDYDTAKKQGKLDVFLNDIYNESYNNHLNELDSILFAINNFKNALEESEANNMENIRNVYDGFSNLNLDILLGLQTSFNDSVLDYQTLTDGNFDILHSMYLDIGEELFDDEIELMIENKKETKEFNFNEFGEYLDDKYLLFNEKNISNNMIKHWTEIANDKYEEEYLILANDYLEEMKKGTLHRNYVEKVLNEHYFKINLLDLNNTNFDNKEFVNDLMSEKRLDLFFENMVDVPKYEIDKIFDESLLPLLDMESQYFIHEEFVDTNDIDIDTNKSENYQENIELIFDDYNEKIENHKVKAYEDMYKKITGEEYHGNNSKSSYIWSNLIEYIGDNINLRDTDGSLIRNVVKDYYNQNVIEDELEIYYKELINNIKNAEIDNVYNHTHDINWDDIDAEFASIISDIEKQEPSQELSTFEYFEYLASKNNLISLYQSYYDKIKNGESVTINGQDFDISDFLNAIKNQEKAIGEIESDAETAIENGRDDLITEEGSIREIMDVDAVNDINNQNTPSEQLLDFFDMFKSDATKLESYIPEEESENNELQKQKEETTHSKDTQIVQNQDPLIFDLDGNGVRTVGLDNNVYFDHGNNGFRENTGWADSNDGILVIDLNKNKKIDSGRELFGDNTIIGYDENNNPIFAQNGFEALAFHDENNDGVIDSNDSIYNDLNIWVDRNLDGKSSNSELYTLKELKIKSIDLSIEKEGGDAGNGNRFLYTGSYTTFDNEKFDYASLNYVIDNSEGEFSYDIELSKESENMPWIDSLGRVRNFKEATTLDSTLINDVENFSSLSTRKDRLSSVDKILYKWAETSTFDNYKERYYDSHSEYFGNSDNLNNFDKLFIAEAFSGKYLNNTSPSLLDNAIWDELHSYHSNLKSYVYKSLMHQMFLKDFDETIFEVSENIKTFQELEIEILNKNFSNEELTYLALDIKDIYPITLENWDVVSFIKDSIYNGSEIPENLFDDLYEYGYVVFDKDLKDFDIKLFISENIDSFINHTNKEDFQNNGVEIIANDLDNKIKSSLFNDNISSGKGNDVIFAYDGDDIIYGNEGDDIIYDGKGDDTIIYNLGDGNDTIHLSREDDETLTDKLILGTGITLDSITFGVNGDNLVLSIVNGDVVNTLTINGWFDSIDKNDNDHLLKYIEFVDGGLLTTEAITKLAYEDYYEGDDEDNRIYGDNLENIINGNGGNDRIYGRDGDDILNGGNDHDRLYGENGDDILNGGDGNDDLYGDDGDDILTGGQGNDYLYGGYGSNILDGGDGDDSLEAEYDGLDRSEFLFNNVQNTFIGGKGDDTIEDGYHSDVIIYNLGDGHDTIIIEDYDKESDLDQNLDLSTLSEKNDILRFGEGINIQDLSFRRDYGRLIIEVAKGTPNEGSIEIPDWFYEINSSKHKIEIFEFDNGDSFTWEEINEIVKANLYNGTDEADRLESVEGLEGSINTGNGNDDITHHQDFNLEINAGEGNDEIYVSKDSTILYNLGDGNDEITIDKNNDSKEQNINLKFGHGINQDDITFEVEYNNLVLYVHKGKSYEGQITIRNAYHTLLQDDYIEHMLDSIEFSNGNILNVDDINKLAKESIYNKDKSNVDSDYEDNIINEYESSYVSGLYDKNNIIHTGDLDNEIRGQNGNDTIYAGGGNDYIRGNGGSDYLDGGDGNDTIEATYGSGGRNVSLSYEESRFFDVGDTIVGGKGNDRILDSDGSDTIIYNLGDGHDTMYLSSFEKNTEYDWINRANDKLIFGDGITKESLSYEINGSDLILFINKGLENEGSITFERWFSDKTIEEFHFKDGSMLTDKDISSEALKYHIDGTDSNDTLYAERYRDNIINAGLGDDTINDSYDNSNNTFIYNIGDGNDTIRINMKNNSDEPCTDKLVFGEGITENDLSYYLSDNYHLKIVLFEGTENEGSITVTDFLRDDTKNYKIEEFIFNNGTTLNWETVYFKAFENMNGTDNNDGFSGNDSNNTINGFDGSDSLYGNGGDDTIYGGNGNDRIEGRDDNDVLYGDADDDRLYGGDGNDILNGGTGNDDLYGDNGNDIINGGEGNDEIQGGNGKDILNGGAGNDKLGHYRDEGSAIETNLYLDNGNVYNGGTGNDTIYDSYHSDTIIYNLGDGDDKIYMSTYEENLSGDGKSIRQDKLVFGEGITIDDILFKKSSRDLVITIHDGTENEGSINFDDWFSDEDTSIEKIEIFEFSNGETYTWEDINNHINGVADITTQYDLLAQEMASFGSGAEDTINDSNVETRESHFYVEM